MREINSWSFNEDFSPNIIIFYGSDLGLSLSMSRFQNSEFISEEVVAKNIDLFYTESFFSTKSIRSIITSRLLEKLIVTNESSEFERKFIGIVDGKISNKKDKILYVKCDTLNNKSRQWFLSYHSKRLGLNEHKNLQWIQNLDDLKFVVLLEKLGFAEYLNDQPKSTHVEIWPEIRKAQFINSSPVNSIYKHFEMWARENSGSDESLEILFDRVNNNVRQYKNETN